MKEKLLALDLGAQIGGAWGDTERAARAKLDRNSQTLQRVFGPAITASTSPDYLMAMRQADANFGVVAGIKSVSLQRIDFDRHRGDTLRAAGHKYNANIAAVQAIIDGVNE